MSITILATARNAGSKACGGEKPPIARLDLVTIGSLLKQEKL
jgi:hypothetical protein